MNQSMNLLYYSAQHRHLVHKHRRCLCFIEPSHIQITVFDLLLVLKSQILEKELTCAFAAGIDCCIKRSSSSNRPVTSEKRKQTQIELIILQHVWPSCSDLHTYCGGKVFYCKFVLLNTQDMIIYSLSSLATQHHHHQPSISVCPATEVLGRAHRAVQNHEINRPNTEQDAPGCSYASAQSQAVKWKCICSL